MGLQCGEFAAVKRISWPATDVGGGRAVAEPSLFLKLEGARRRRRTAQETEAKELCRVPQGSSRPFRRLGRGRRAREWRRHVTQQARQAEMSRIDESSCVWNCDQELQKRRAHKASKRDGRTETGEPHKQDCQNRSARWMISRQSEQCE